MPGRTFPRLDAGARLDMKLTAGEGLVVTGCGCPGCLAEAARADAASWPADRRRTAVRRAVYGLLLILAAAALAAYGWLTIWVAVDHRGWVWAWIGATWAAAALLALAGRNPRPKPGRGSVR